VSINGKMTETHLCDSFVGNVTTVETYDNHRTKQIPSSVTELTQEEEGIVSIMEEILKLFLDLLTLTGGDLVQ
jgi:hypothetical protein